MTIARRTEIGVPVAHGGRDRGGAGAADWCRLLSRVELLSPAWIILALSIDILAASPKVSRDCTGTAPHS